MKAIRNLIRQKNWLERLADFLLGPAPQPIYVVGAAAFNGGRSAPTGHPKENGR